MSHIECSNMTVFMEMMDKLRKDGVKFKAAADDLGVFHIFLK